MTSMFEMSPGLIWQADQSLLSSLLQTASDAPRRRTHLILHQDHSDPVQRLLIAAVDGTYVAPHTHSDQWEVLSVLSGSGRLLQFNADGELTATVNMQAGASSILQIPPGIPHSFVVTGPSAVVLEVKPGPYRPNEFVEWGPEEGSDAARHFVTWAQTADAGDAWQTAIQL